MSEDTITIEVDGEPFKARKGQMLIEVTDDHGIYVPRFCYHKKLAVAANCRMCLVEVEKAPKPLPACATPVVDGMKVKTKSRLAMEAQKSVMEFLLINHPLDCPICDQGGECELQDLAMGYGSDVSRYHDQKRVVKDKNIGPLVQTDMTRCIHCTRCVRFGEEVAGLRELGATGRGEHMEIGTYIEKSMVSELSGNVIDLCPVGALTSKPFRFSARTWEMSQRPGIAPHDAIGSNIHFHTKGERVKRVVPADNEAINEVWLSDRDRFSYEGLYSADRLGLPMIKENGKWEEVEWETALQFTEKKLQTVINAQGVDQVGVIVSPTATTEELYLLQKLLRESGIRNIDHRLHQTDFSDQAYDPLFPWLGQSIEDLEQLDAALVIGGNPRKQQPLLNHRLRKAALKGADVMFVNAVSYDINYRKSAELISRPTDLSAALAGILKALVELAGVQDDTNGLLNNVTVSDQQRMMAEKLYSAEKNSLLLGNLALAHPQFSTLRYLAGKIAALSNATLGYLGEAANSAGAYLAGAVPHRGPAGVKIDKSGRDVQSMLADKLQAYLLFNVEPELDCNNGRQALEAMQAAGCVIAVTPYRSEKMEEYADVLLPMALYAENEGSYINVEGKTQTFSAAVPPPGEARPAWKILRVLADVFGVEHCHYDSVQDLGNEIQSLLADLVPDNQSGGNIPGPFPASNGAIERITDMPMNAVDSLVRRASALQQTQEAADDTVHVNAELAMQLGLGKEGRLSLEQDGVEMELNFVTDEQLPRGTVMLHAAHPDTFRLGQWFSTVNVKKAG